MLDHQHSQTLQSVVMAWLDQLAIQQHSELTIQAYHRDVMVFLNYCQQQHWALDQIQSSDLRQYISHCVEHKQWSNPSIQRSLSAIRQFMQHLQQGTWQHNSQFKDFKIKRDPRPLPGLLSADNLKQLLDQPAPQSAKQQWLWCRDKAILELLYSSGLRLSELVNLSLAALDWAQHLIRVTGKGNKTRIVPFGQKAAVALQQWLVLRQQVDLAHDYVFISQSGRQIGDRQVQNRIKLQAQRAGLSADLHPHLLRHCFASHLLSASSDLRVVQEMLGHSNLNTTQIYTHLDFEHLAAVYDQAHPRAKQK
jgi:integrase/recombinase XerC